MTARLFCLASLAVLALTGTLPAGDSSCRSATCAQHQAVAAAVVVTAPSLVTVPLYGASYSGGDTSDAELKDLLRQLIEEQRATRAEIAALRGGAGPFKAAGAPGLDPIAVLTKNCQSCHSGEKPAGGYSMFDDAGSLLKPSPPERRSIEARAVKKGDMPPSGKPKLTAEEKAAVEAFVATPAAKK